ncbi:MAG: hypothetical protein AAFO07_26200 [Bacteroidota bacterium]
MLRNKIWVAYLAVVLSSSSCVQLKKEKIICHSKSNRCIRILDQKSSRTIYFDQNLKSEYVKLDISKINKVMDGIFVCFYNGRIEIINPQSLIIESNFNENSYSFSNKMELDNKGLPNILKFHQEDCFEFNMKAEAIFPKNGSVYIK